MESQKQIYLELFDRDQEETNLSQLVGFTDCENCYFRNATIERITKDVKKLRGGV